MTVDVTTRPRHLESYVAGQWARGAGKGTTLLNAATGAPVAVIDSSGIDFAVPVHTFGGAGHWAGQFYGAHNLAIDSKGNLYITETYEGKRVQKFTYTGMGPSR